MKAKPRYETAKRFGKAAKAAKGAAKAPKSKAPKAPKAPVAPSALPSHMYKTLAMQRPAMEEAREKNWNVMRGRQRRTVAANAQALHDRYQNEIMLAPPWDGLRLVNTTKHRNELADLLKGMNAFQDPRMPLPSY